MNVLLLQSLRHLHKQFVHHVLLIKLGAWIEAFHAFSMTLLYSLDLGWYFLVRSDLTNYLLLIIFKLSFSEPPLLLFPQLLSDIVGFH